MLSMKCFGFIFLYCPLQALKADAYDHYTAIYYLLLERLRSHRSSFPIDGRMNCQKRRPSSIAEQAIYSRVGGPSGHQTPPHMGMMALKQFGQSTDSGMGHHRDSLGSELEGMGGGGGMCLQDILSSLQTPVQPAQMITTSIDEGVEVDIMDSRDVEDNLTHKQVGQVLKDGVTGLMPSSAFGDFSQLSNTSLTSLGTGSPFASFDSTLESELVSSLGVFSSDVMNMNTGTLNTSVNVDQCGSSLVPSNYMTMQMQNLENPFTDRSQNTSPVDFREGRRASDGLVAQGIIAFRQRLKESMKSPGMTELRPEHQQFHHAYGMRLAPSSLLQDHTEETEHQMIGGGQVENEKPRPRPLIKRMSLPSETADMQPHRLLALKQCHQLEQQMVDRGTSQEAVQPQPIFGESSKPLQQQLLQHRLQQKRQSFHQKHAPNPVLHQQMQQLQLEAHVHQTQQQQQALFSCSQASSHAPPPMPSACDTYPTHTPHNPLTSVAVAVSMPHSTSLVHSHADPSLSRPHPIIRKISYKLAQQQPVVPGSDNGSDSELLPWQRAILEQQTQLQGANNESFTGGLQNYQNPAELVGGRRSGCVNFFHPVDFQKQTIQNQTISEFVDFSQFNEVDFEGSNMDTGDQGFSLDNYVQTDDMTVQGQGQIVTQQPCFEGSKQGIMGNEGYFYTQQPTQQSTFNMAVSEDISMDMS